MKDLRGIFNHIMLFPVTKKKKKKRVIEATFTQQQITVFSPVFESLIRLRSHRVRLMMRITIAFYNQTHTCKFSGLTTSAG